MENIRYARPEATDRGGDRGRQPWPAAASSSRDLPEGFNTMVGDRGT